MEYEQQIYGRSSFDPTRERRKQRRRGSGGALVLAGLIISVLSVISVTVEKPQRDVTASTDTLPTRVVPVVAVTE